MYCFSLYIFTLNVLYLSIDCVIYVLKVCCIVEI